MDFGIVAEGRHKLLAPPERESDINLQSHHSSMMARTTQKSTLDVITKESTAVSVSMPVDNFILFSFFLVQRLHFVCLLRKDFSLDSKSINLAVDGKHRPAFADTCAH